MFIYFWCIIVSSFFIRSFSFTLSKAFAGVLSSTASSISSLNINNASMVFRIFLNSCCSSLIGIVGVIMSARFFVYSFSGMLIRVISR